MWKSGFMKVVKTLYSLIFLALSLVLVGCGSGGNGGSDNKNAVTPTPEPPTPDPILPSDDFTFSGRSLVAVNENTTDISVGYSLSGSFTRPISYSLLESDDADLFSINPQSGQLKFKESPDYEAPKDADNDNTYNLVIEAKTSGGSSDNFALKVKVSNVEEKPTLSLDPVIEVKEGEIDVVLLEPSSADGEVKMELFGDDRERFVILNDGRLQFLDVPDFELPLDSDRNNEFELTIWLYDNGVQENKVILSVKVIDDLEVVEINQVNPVALDGKISTGFRMLSNSAQGGIQLKIAGGADAKLFKVNQETFELEFINAPDIQNPNDDNGDGKYEIELQGENADGEICNKSYILPLLSQAKFNLEIFMPVSRVVPIKLDKAQKFTFSGKLTDLKGKPILQSDIVQFTANNGLVTYNEDSGMWNSTVHIGNGNQTVQIVVKDSNGNALVVSRYFQVEPTFELNSESGFAFDSIHNRVFLASTSGIIAFDLDNQQRIKSLELPSTQISQVKDFAFNKTTENLYALTSNQIWVMDASTQSWGLKRDYSKDENPYLRSLRSLSLSEPNNEFYLLSEDIDEKAHVFKADLDNSTMQQITKSDTEPFIVGPGKIEYDDSNDRLLVTDWRTESVLTVAKDSGTIRKFSIDKIENGWPIEFDYPEGMAIDEATNTCWIVDDNGANYSTLMSMDLDTGQLTPLRGTGTEPFELSDIAIDSTNSRLLAIDTIRHHLIEIDPITGERAVLIGNHIGKGSYLSKPTAMGLDTVNQKAYTSAANGSIIEIDLLNGDRRTVTGLSKYLNKSIGKGLGHSIIESIEVDVKGSRLFVADTGRDAVFTVDIKTGDRSLLSSTSEVREKIGEGIDIPAAVDIEFDAQNNVLYVIDLTSDALITIDPETGDRKAISSANIGQGPVFDAPMAVEIDSDNDIAYVADVLLEKIFKVDMKTGDRSIMQLSDSLPSLSDVLYQNFDQADLELDKKNQLLYVGFAEYAWRWVIDLKNGFTLTRLDNLNLGSPVALEVDFDRGIAYQIGYYSQSLWATDIKNSQTMEVSR